MLYFSTHQDKLGISVLSDSTDTVVAIRYPAGIDSPTPGYSAPVVEAYGHDYKHIFSVVAVIKNLAIDEEKHAILLSLPKLMRHLEKKDLPQGVVGFAGKVLLIKDIAINDGLKLWKCDDYEAYAKDMNSAKLKIKEKVLEKLMENEEDVDALNMLAKYKKWEVKESKREIVEYTSQKEVCEYWAGFKPEEDEEDEEDEEK